MENKGPLVSILIPNYNKAAYIRETLDSVVAQTYTNWECLVVDDHSTDESWKILEEYSNRDSRIFIYRRPISFSKGGNYCRNFAIEKSIGSFVFFLDSDDVLAEFCIDQRIETAMKYPDLDFWAFPTALFENEVSDALYYWNLDRLDESDLSRFLRMDVLWQTSGCIYKKEFITKLNGLTPDRVFWQDYEMHLKALISTNKYKKFFHLAPDVYIRNGDNSSLSRSTPFTGKWEVLLIRIHFLEEIYSYLKDEGRDLTKGELISLLSFQYYLILNSWIKHGRWFFFIRKWFLYCIRYDQSIYNFFNGCSKAMVVKVYQKTGNLERVKESLGSGFPSCAILDSVQVGKHRLRI